MQTNAVAFSSTSFTTAARLHTAGSQTAIDIHEEVLKAAHLTDGWGSRTAPSAEVAANGATVACMYAGEGGASFSAHRSEQQVYCRQRLQLTSAGMPVVTSAHRWSACAGADLHTAACTAAAGADADQGAPAPLQLLPLQRLSLANLLLLLRQRLV